SALPPAPPCPPSGWDGISRPASQPTTASPMVAIIAALRVVMARPKAGTVPAQCGRDENPSDGFVSVDLTDGLHRSPTNRTVDRRLRLSDLRVAIRLGATDAVSLQLQSECAARDFEQLRGSRLVPGATIESLDDALPLLALGGRQARQLRVWRRRRGRGG